MSKSAMSVLTSEIRTERSCAYRAESDLKHLDKSILNAMDDRVGYSARQSLAGIRHHFTCNMDEGLNYAEVATRTLEAGYTKIDELTAQANSLLLQANNIVTELGNL